MLVKFNVFNDKLRSGGKKAGTCVGSVVSVARFGLLHVLGEA